MPFDNIISRTDADSLIPEEVATEVIKVATEQSAALSMFRRLSMGSKISRMPVLSALASAYFVSGDTGLKQTTEESWAGVTLEAEEIAAIVPIPEAVLDDAGIDVWAEVQEGLAEAVAVALDAAIFTGTNKPASWPSAIIPAATAAGNTVVVGTATQEEGGIVGDVDTALDQIEAAGYDATGLAAARSLRGLLRRARDTSGQRLADVGSGSIEGVPLSFVPGGVFAPTVVGVAGDYSMAVLGLRQDLTFKVLDQAVLTDNAGAVIYNLPQQDMLAMRVTFRAGYALANPVTREEPNAAERFPFSVLTTV